MEAARDDGEAAALGATQLTAEASDAQLVARCRTGDEDAWRELVDRFSRYVYAICVQAFRLPEHDAEDVYQEVFARVYEKLETLREDDAFRPWIAQLTRRRCLDALASRGRETPADDELMHEETADLADVEEAFAVREALAGLSETCQEMLDRFFARDQSYRTIGEELDIPSGTIASRIARCLGRLRDQLEGRNPPAEGSRG